MFSQLRKGESIGGLAAAPLTAAHGRGLYKSGERVENSLHLARVFEPVSSVSSLGLIAHDFGKPQRSKNIAGARYAAADGSGNLTGTHLFTFRE